MKVPAWAVGVAAFVIAGVFVLAGVSIGLSLRAPVAPANTGPEYVDVESEEGQKILEDYTEFQSVFYDTLIGTTRDTALEKLPGGKLLVDHRIGDDTYETYDWITVGGVYTMTFKNRGLVSREFVPVTNPPHK